MLAEAVVDLVDLVRRHGETDGIEAKATSGGLPTSAAESICGFANSPGGGVLLLGLDERADFSVVGVADTQKIQQDVVGVCRDVLEPRSKGINRGSYLRVANTVRRLTTEEVQQIVADRGQPRFDRGVVDEARLGDLDRGIVSAYIARLRTGQPHIFGALDDNEILDMTNVVARSADGEPRPTLAGLLAMASYPQRHHPQLDVTFVSYATPDGISDVEGRRFLDNVRVDGPIPVMVRDVMAAILRNMRRRAVISAEGRRDVWEYPPDALRELVVNALVHRDLSPGSRGTQVQVEMYPDRVRILNPGGLFGAVEIDRLGEAGVASARNADLLRILEEVIVPGDNRTVCENRGSGIRVVVAAAAAAGLPTPIFRDKVTAFEVVLRNAPAGAGVPGGTVPAHRTRLGLATTGRINRARDILDVIRARGEASRAEIAKDLGLTQKNTSYWLGRLRADGLVEPTKDGTSPHARYRVRD